jgi:hypothetical protein
MDVILPSQNKWYFEYPISWIDVYRDYQFFIYTVMVEF